MPGPRRRRWRKPLTGSHSCSAAAPSPRAHPLASRFSALTQKPAGHWKKPIARCMCARRKGGTKPNVQSLKPSRVMTIKPTRFTFRLPEADIADLRDQPELLADEGRAIFRDLR